MMSKVGIIVNPSSGKDIRRLIGYGSVYGNEEKINIVKRIITALLFSGVEEIIYMSDPYSLVDTAISRLNKADYLQLTNKLHKLDMPLHGTKTDSITAGFLMAEHKTDCIIVLGGDGTSRVVAMGCGNTPILPVSTGTNNVFPYHIEGSSAGLAAGLFSVNKLDKKKVISERKHFNLFINDVFKDIALVDLVVYDDPYISNKAMWKAEKMLYVAVTSAGTGSIGMSSVISNFRLVSDMENNGWECYINPENPQFYVGVPIAPGLFNEIPIEKDGIIPLNTRIPVMINRKKSWLTIALDGEKEYEVNLEKDCIEIEVERSRVRVLEPDRVMEEAVGKGLLVRKGKQSV